MAMITLLGLSAYAASRSTCSGSPSNFADLQNLSVTATGAGTFHSSVTLAGSRGCAYLVESYYAGTASGNNPTDDYAYARYTFQDGVYYGSDAYNEYLDPTHPCDAPFSTIDHATNTMHGLDTIDFYYVDGSGCSGVSAHFFNVAILDAYDDSGDIVFDVSSLPADGLSKAHARLTNPNAFPTNVLVWQINGSTDEETLGCTIDSKGEITAGKVSGKITVRAYCSDTTNNWIEQDLRIGCNTCQNGCTDGSAQLGSVLVSINAGNTAFGDSAGHFEIREEYPSAALSTPTVLKYYTGGLTTNDVTVVRSNGIVSQVIAPQISANVVSNSAYQYQINFYTNSTPTGTPLTTWTIENPDGASSSNRLFVSQSTGGLTNEYDYVWNGTLNGWELTTQGGARVEKRYNSTNGVLRTETHLILDGSAHIKFQETNVYQSFAWGERQIKRTVGTGSNALVTTWSYHTNATDTTNYSRLYQVVTPGNHWERYYHDTSGRVIRKVVQYLDAPIPTSTAQENTNRLELTYYYNDSSGYPIEEIYNYLGGNETSWSQRYYSSDFVQETQEQTAGLYYDSDYDLITHTTISLTPPFVGEPAVVLRPDGTMSFYDYALSADGNYRTNTVTSGQPNGGKNQIVDGTKTVTVLNKAGITIASKTYDVASGLLTSSAVALAVDTRGRPTAVQYLDGTTETTVYGCCGVDSFTDRQGITTSYDYDSYTKQVTTMTRAGITTVYTYDAAGNLVQTTRIGTDSSQIVQNVSAFDTAGRLVTSTPADNGSGLSQTTTNLEYFDDSNHRVNQTTYPDGGTRMETYYQDGSLLSVTGTAVHTMQYSYGMDTSSAATYGEYTREIKTGPNGETTEYSQTHRDPLGRSFFTWFSVSSGNNPYVYSYFKTNGQVWAQVDRDGIGTLYAYNGKGQLLDSALDMNLDSSINYGGLDRITRTVADVTTNNGITVLRTRTYAWSTNGVNASNLVATVETSADGLKTWNVVWNNGVGLTNTSTTYFAGSGDRYVTNTAPDGSYGVSYYHNDFLTSVTSKDSASNQIGQVSYAYDPHGRQYQVTDARTGTTTYGFNDADQVTTVTTPAPAQVTSVALDGLGRVLRTTLPDSTQVTNEYYLTGDLKRTYGSRTYPVAYGYDSQGRVTTMTNWSDFAGNSGARVTTWKYDGYTGFMTNKVYDGNTAGPSYTFTLSGKPKTRLWARGITTTYGYNNAGDLQTVSYSDGTAGITNGYDRLGQRIAVTNGATICSFAYNQLGEPLSESYSGGPLSGLVVSNRYDGLLRRTNVTLLNTSTVLTATGYGYDAASRLAEVSDGTNSASYSYLANSPLVQTIAFTNNGSWRMTTTKSYDNLNRLLQIASTPSAASAISFAYGYNSANQRTAVTNADSSRWSYGYDALGQVTSGKKYWSDSSAVSGQQFEYTFDDIGNRKTTGSGGDATGANLRYANYTNNSLNHITSRSVPSYVNILGEATNASTVTLWADNGAFSPTSRKGDYFRGELTVTNSSALWLGITNLAVLNNGTNADIIATNTGNLFVAQTPETFLYDADGNLTNDGRWMFTWDAENRLVKMESQGTAPVASKLKLEFTYDAYGRRTQKIVSTNNGTIYVGQYTNHFAYDGWNLLATLDNQLSTLKAFLWGMDMSGTSHGAGGVGGLLAIRDASGSHLAGYDGNGNLAVLVNATSGAVSANYEYGPFGELLRATGVFAKNNPFRFSTKYQDDETDLLYYGFRYYIPSSGRWLSCDPIGEQGGLNLYGVLANDMVDFLDLLGLEELIHRADSAEIGAKIFEDGLKPGVETGGQWANIWMSDAKGQVRPGGTRLHYDMNISAAKEIPCDVISQAMRSGSKLQGADQGRAVWKFINEWIQAQDHGVWKVPTAAGRLVQSSEATGYYYAFRSSAAWKSCRPRLLRSFGLRLPKYLKVGGRVLVAVAIAADAYEIYTADNKPRTITKVVGGWAGAWVGAELGGEGGAVAGGAIGVWFFGAGAVPGAGIGGVIGSIGGGITGYIIGSKTAEVVYDIVQEGFTYY
jgi:RHS repeat-associated protein